MKLLMLFASERTPFSPLDLQQPKSHHSLVPQQYSGDIITIHSCSKYLTWFLQAFKRENHIWDWEYWVVSLGGWMGRWGGGILEEFQTICLFLFFIFYVNSMYLPVPQHTRCCQKYLRTSLISRLRGTLLHSQWLSTFFTPNCPQSRGLGRAQRQCQQLLSFWNSGLGMEVFQSPELWIFCSTSAFLCRGQEVDWEGVALYLCGDCFHCLPRAVREAAEWKGRIMALESVRPVFVSQRCTYLCVLGQTTWISPRPILVIYKMGFIVIELAVLMWGLNCIIMERLSIDVLFPFDCCSTTMRYTHTRLSAALSMDGFLTPVSGSMCLPNSCQWSR